MISLLGSQLRKTRAASAARHAERARRAQTTSSRPSINSTGSEEGSDDDMPHKVEDEEAQEEEVEKLEQISGIEQLQEDSEPEELDGYEDRELAIDYGVQFTRTCTWCDDKIYPPHQGPCQMTLHPRMALGPWKLVRIILRSDNPSGPTHINNIDATLAAHGLTVSKVPYANACGSSSPEDSTLTQLGNLSLSDSTRASSHTRRPRPRVWDLVVAIEHLPQLRAELSPIFHLLGADLDEEPQWNPTHASLKLEEIETHGLEEAKAKAQGRWIMSAVHAIRCGWAIGTDEAFHECARANGLEEELDRMLVIEEDAKGRGYTGYARRAGHSPYTTLVTDQLCPELDGTS